MPSSASAAPRDHAAPAAGIALRPVEIYAIGWLAGERLRVVTDRSVILYDASLRPLAKCELPENLKFGDMDGQYAISRDAGRLALEDEKGKFFLFDSAHCAAHRVPVSHRSFPDGDVAIFSVSGDGRRYALSENDYVEVHDVASDRLLAIRRVLHRDNGLRTLSGGALTANGQIIWLAAADECYRGDSCDSDGRFYLDDKTITDTAKNKSVRLGGGLSEDDPWKYALSPDLRQLAFVGQEPKGPDVLAIAAPRTGRILARISLDRFVKRYDAPEELRYSAESDRLAVLLASDLMDSRSSRVAVLGVAGNKLQVIGAVP